MSDSTGSRTDLRIESSRCLPIRFNESSCRRCIGICPHNAITLEGQLSVNQERCTGCLLCTTVCPSGALEMNQNFDSCLASLATVTDPVLGCSRTAYSANAAIPCLGGLSSEHLLALLHAQSGVLITLNLSRCGDCSNNVMVPILQKRLQSIVDAGMDRGGGRIVPEDAGERIKVQEVHLNRRSFFKSLRSTLFQSAAAAIAGTTDQTEQRSDYAEKRVPLRKILLNRTINGLALELQQLVHSHCDSNISFNAACTTCQGCAAICPTGALQTKSPEVYPLFLPENCTGCGLCVEFCLDGALSLMNPA